MGGVCSGPRNGRFRIDRRRKGRCGRLDIRHRPRQESSLLRRRSDRQRNRCGIDRDIPQILRASALEDFRLLGERCHLALAASASRTMSNLIRCIKRHDEMLACETHIESLTLHRFARRKFEHLACHRLNESDRTSEQRRWSCVAHLRLVLGRQPLDILRLGLAFEFRCQLCGLVLRSLWLRLLHAFTHNILSCMTCVGLSHHANCNTIKAGG